MRVRSSMVVALIAALVAAGPAAAGVVVFIDNQPAFNAAAAPFTLVGTESFEESNLAANQIQSFDDPLLPGVANGPFPMGTLTATGIRVQGNTLGGNPTTPSPSGAAALTTASLGYIGTPSDQISTNDPLDSFDMIFAPANGQFVRAVGMVPLYFDGASTTPTSNPGTIEIRVYAANGTTLLTTAQTMTAVNFAGTRFFGVVTNGGDSIGRINLWSTTGTNHFQGADDITVRTSVSAPVVLTGFEVD